MAKITFLLPPLCKAGGIRVIANIAQNLHLMGHDVNVFSSTRPLRRRERILRKLWLYRQPLDDESYFDNLSVPSFIVNRDRIAASALPDADFVVATFFTTAFWLNELPLSKGEKVYFVQQYEANQGHNAAKVDSTWRMGFNIIACSEWLRQFGSARFGVEDISVVPNGIEKGLFDAPPRSRNSTPVIGALCSSQPHKRFPLICDVIERVRRTRPTTKLLLLGTSRPDVVPSNVEFYENPRQSDLSSIYSKCDVWLCTSTSEGFHLPPHEAMACRTPVVSTRVGGPMDLIENGVEGFLCEIEDAKCLSNHCQELLACSLNDWSAFSDAAYAKAHSYSWEHAATLFHHALLKTRVQA